MKRILLMLLTVFMIFSLVACGQSNDDDDDKRKSKKKDKSKTEEVDTEYGENDEDEEDVEDEQVDGESEEEPGGESKAESEEDDNIEEIPEEDDEVTDSSEAEKHNEVVDVLFEKQYTDCMEYAVLKGVTAEDEVVWTYETEQYPVAQLDSLIPIGIYNEMYYYQEAGSIIAIDPQSAELIWRNNEFSGSIGGYDFDENGTIYLCGYFGPDLMIIDKEGKTLCRKGELNPPDYYWPYEVDYDQGYVFITYESNSGYYWEEKYFWENEEKRKYEGYGLSYCLADGSIGYEHNVLEPGFSYQGFYQRANGTERPDEMQIDYLGENIYLISINIVSEAYMPNMIGHLINDTIIFSDEFGGNTYKAMLSKTDEGISLVIKDTSNVAVSVNTEYLFTVDLQQEPVAEELTSEQLMTKIISVTATSALTEKNTTHLPEFVTDGDLKTGWVEGVSGQGTGETLTITFDGEYKVEGFLIYAGYQKSESLYEKNSRPAILEVTLSNGETEAFYLDDFYGGQVFKLSNPAVISGISFSINSVYAGSTYEDTVISEIKLYSSIAEIEIY